jgi:hypothetical protein
MYEIEAMYIVLQIYLPAQERKRPELAASDDEPV